MNTADRCSPTRLSISGILGVMLVFILIAVAMSAASATGLTMSHFTASSTVSTNSPFANSVVIRGPQGTYFFQPNSRVTLASPYVLVRSYGSLFVFNSANVRQMRYLSESAATTHPLSSLAKESNAALVKSLLATKPVLGQNNAPCSDCAFPQAARYLVDQPFGSEKPIPAPTLSYDAAAAAKCAIGATCSGVTTVSSSSPHTVQPLSLVYSNGFSCFPATYMYAEQLHSCVPPAQAAAAVGRIAPDFTVGVGFVTESNYVWALFSNETLLTWQTNNSNYIREVLVYADIEGGSVGPVYAQGEIYANQTYEFGVIGGIPISVSLWGAIFTYDLFPFGEVIGFAPEWVLTV